MDPDIFCGDTNPDRETWYIYGYTHPSAGDESEQRMVVGRRAAFDKAVGLLGGSSAIRTRLETTRFLEGARLLGAELELVNATKPQFWLQLRRVIGPHDAGY